jgi:hypothetical protein
MSAASGRPAVLGQAASTAGGDEAALRLYNAYTVSSKEAQLSALQTDAIRRD